MVIGLTTYKSVNGFTDEQLNLMRAFLQGAVYCWCKNRKDEWFAARDLLGGDNYFWQGTPMVALYEKSENVEQAGKDAGWLLKQVIDNDKRSFETKKEGLVRQYRWNLKENETTNFNFCCIGNYKFLCIFGSFYIEVRKYKSFFNKHTDLSEWETS